MYKCSTISVNKVSRHLSKFSSRDSSSADKQKRRNEKLQNKSTIGMRTHGPRQSRFNWIRFFVDVISV